jgi:Fe-S-cluster containining protein
MADEEANQRDVAEAWIGAVGRDDVARELGALFGRAREAIERRGPACWASGRCCNFARAGHRLYVTGLEAAWTAAQVRRSRGERLGAGSDEVRAGREVSLRVLGTGDDKAGPPPLTSDAVARARVRGDCPFLVDNACSVHESKPLACRVYFCDREAQEWQHELTEELQRELRALHDRLGIPYRYAEWRDLLEMLV